MNVADIDKGKEGAPPVAPSTSQNLRTRIDELSSEPIEALQAKWQRRFRNPAPPYLPRYLLIRILAYKVQADELGDLDPASVRYLKRVAQDRANRLADPNRRKGKAPPPIPPVAASSLKPGTILVREHGGQLHHVVVGSDGFSWNDKSYRSLSEVAQAITGTKWNGPRFFGLRDKKAGKLPPQASERSAS